MALNRLAANPCSGDHQHQQQRNYKTTIFHHNYERSSSQKKWMICDTFLDHSWQDLNVYIEYNYFDATIAALFPAAHHGLHILMVHLITILTPHHGLLATECLLSVILAVRHLLAVLAHHGLLAAAGILLAILAYHGGQLLAILAYHGGQLLAVLTRHGLLAAAGILGVSLAHHRILAATGLLSIILALGNLLAVLALPHLVGIFSHSIVWH